MSAPVDDRERALALAKGYPYAAPRSSFVLAGGRELALDSLPAHGLRRDDLAARTPVLAYGANRTPEALRRKAAAPGFPAASALVVLRARLRGLDVVHSAHVSPYGSIGSTLAASPGTSVEVCVTLLTEAQLAAMTETEPNYTLEELHEVDVELDGGVRLERVCSYVSRHGALVHEGSEVALEAIPAHDRRLPTLSQPQALAAAAARTGHRGTLDEFILANVADPELAARCTRELRRDARALDWPRTPARRAR